MRPPTGASGRRIRPFGLALAIAFAFAGALVGASDASAGIDNIYSGGLSPNRQFASTYARYRVTAEAADTNHTACIGDSTGWAGYANPPAVSGSYELDGPCVVDPTGGASYYVNDYRHGYVANFNTSTDVSFTSSYFSWTG
jgi:hypothetical protein